MMPYLVLLFAWIAGSLTRCLTLKQPAVVQTPPLLEPLKRGPLATVWGGPCDGKTHPSPTERAPELRRYFYLGRKRYAKYSWDVTRWLFVDIATEAEYLNSQPSKELAQ